jgi:hypothetical protein
MISVRGEICSLSGAQTAAVKVNATGTDVFGNAIHWRSPWEPSSLSVTREWRPFTLLQEVGPTSEVLKDVKVSLQAQPYDDASFLAHPERCAKQDVAIRRLTVEVLPPLELIPDGRRDWIVF